MKSFLVEEKYLCIVNTMDVDDQIMQGARASSAMVLI